MLWAFPCISPQVMYMWLVYLAYMSGSTEELLIGQAD